MATLKEVEFITPTINNTTEVIEEETYTVTTTQHESCTMVSIPSSYFTSNSSIGTGMRVSGNGIEYLNTSTPKKRYSFLGNYRRN